MMPLKEQTTENKVEKKEDSGALKTEEILSLLSKTRQDFIKDQEILEKIPNLFKKKTLIELANNSANKKTKNQELEKPQILEKKENKELNNESKTDKEEILEKKIDEKKYTEVEAKKMANDLAKEYYNKGYYLGVKKTKEENKLFLLFKLFIEIKIIIGNEKTIPVCFEKIDAIKKKPESIISVLFLYFKYAK